MLQKFFSIYLPKMKRIVAISVFTLCFMGFSIAQQNESEDMRPKADEPVNDSIVKRIKTWKLTDNFTQSDTLVPDTFLLGFQVFNPVLKNNPFSLHTGNQGGPSQSYSLGNLDLNQDYIFMNSLSLYLPSPENYLYYNTTVPYTNLTYYQGSPKSQSEEYLRVFFTQNITPNWNMGVTYTLMSSIGRYASQRHDNQMFRFFMSYNAAKYSVHGNFAFNSINHEENGGVEEDNYILHPEEYDDIDPQNIPVNLISAKNLVRNFRVSVHQSYGIGRLHKDTLSEGKKTPVGTLFHTLDIGTYRRVFRIGSLDDYFNKSGKIPMLPHVYSDSLRTRDTSAYKFIRNVFQIKLNEEANPWLRFGLRAFIDNEIKIYDQPNDYHLQPSGYYSTIYHSSDTVFTTTSLGGQIFKNQGRNFWWQGGMKFFFQGYKAGDSELTGKVNSLFPVGKDTAGVYASGGVYLQSPGYYTEQYSSNHIMWNKNFSREKTIKLKGGIRIPTRRMEMSAEMRLVHNYLYWGEDTLPHQSDEIVQAYELKLFKHFKAGGFNSVNYLSYQVSSRPKILPLPMFAFYSSNFFEKVAFKVLKFQIGFDTRYFTAYYAPSYSPVTGQFYNQQQIKTGDYPYVDAFLNFHLKRARLGFKYEHANLGYPSNDYFIIPHYPGNPSSFKIYVSWNFFD